MLSQSFKALLFSSAVCLVSAGTIIDTGSPNGLMAVASRPNSPGKSEIEAADDFVLNTQAFIASGHFTGLLTGGNPTISQVGVEIYRVFPKDSILPASGNVPTRVNSPSDVAFTSADSTGVLTFTTQILNGSFTTANSVLSGINKIPNQLTGGEGSVTGEEVLFWFTLTTPFNLPADHYFFIPQVQTSGQFYWLSSARPDTTTVFSPDLQAWVRNSNLAPDWLRVGTDVVGGNTPPQFNMSFDLQSAASTPEPSTLWMFAAGAIATAILRRRG